MSIANLLFPQGDFLDIKANAPDQRSYNIDATRDLVENNPLGIIGETFAPVSSLVTSPFYDAIQASQRMEPGSGIAGFAKAFDAENPISSALERAYGATLPLAERISNMFSMGQAEASDLGAIANNEMLQSILNPKTPTLGESYFDRTNRTSPIVEDDPYPPEFFPNDQQNSLNVDMGATGTIPTLNNTGIMSAVNNVPFGTSVDNIQGFTDKEDFSKAPEPSGLRRLISSLSPLGLLRRIAASGQPFQRFTPGTTINTPLSAFGGDFYNPRTGLNRFDRAAQRFKKTGSMKDLFAASRSGSEFFRRRREELAKRERRAKAANQQRLANQQYFGGGDDNSFGGGVTKSTPASNTSTSSSYSEAAYGRKDR